MAPMNPEIKTTMAALAEELKKPKRKQNARKIKNLNDTLDQLLGTEDKKEDSDRGEAWERGRR